MVGGVNVIRNLLEETNEHIIESIDNLHYMRFVFNRGVFRHHMSSLGIIKSSPYYKELESRKMLEGWSESNFDKFLPKNYILEESKYNIVLDYIKTTYNGLWDYFQNIENNYIINNFEYNIAKLNNEIIYREIFNKEVVKELYLSSIDWEILCLCNDQVRSIDDIFILLQKNLILENIAELKVYINDLNDEGLVYATNDYLEIVTVINTIQLH